MPAEAAALRWVVLGAHPDDETIGAGALMARCPPQAVLLLTAGAPRDLAWAPAAGRAGLDRDAYARARRAELESALDLAGVPAERVHFLDGVDQEVARELPRLARDLADRLAALAPDLVVTHPYEGGHPDHDAAAFLARAAAALLARRGARAPELAEMACYHAEDGRLAAGSFLPAPRSAGSPIVLALSAAERERKRRMIARFATQEETLRPFLPAVAESFRPAPPCRFDRPPHPGPLLYELWGFPLDGARFRALAAGAAAELELSELALEGSA